MSEPIPPEGPWTGWRLCIGVDVGGTNTDAVLMCGQHVLAWHKAFTTKDITGGVEESIRETLRKFLSSPRCEGLTYEQLTRRVSRVCIGTTHFVNAVVERRQRDLGRVVVIRLCSDSSRALPPFCDFPESLARCMKAHPRCYFFAQGGYYFDARPISNVSCEEIQEIGQQLLADGVQQVVISGVFTTLQRCGQQEVDAERYLREVFNNANKNLSVTQSHKVRKLTNLLYALPNTVIESCFVGCAFKIVCSKT